MIRGPCGSPAFLAAPPPPNIARPGPSAILIPMSGNGVGRNPTRPESDAGVPKTELTDGFSPFRIVRPVFGTPAFRTSANPWLCLLEASVDVTDAAWSSTS
jgi:hypothetical protein